MVLIEMRIALMGSLLEHTKYKLNRTSVYVFVINEIYGQRDGCFTAQTCLAILSS